MEILRRHLGWAVLMSEFGHIFCCVLPTIFTVLSFAANIGMIGMAPAWMLALHEHIHQHEVTIIIFSGIVLVMGWAVLLFSRRVDCHDTGCGHPPCGPVKDKNRIIMIVATFLFLANFAIYTLIHKNIFHLSVFANAVVEKDNDHDFTQEGATH